MIRRLFLVIVCWGWGNLANAGALNIAVNDEDNNPIQDAVVIAVPILEPKATQDIPKTFVIDQIDKEFVSQVSVIRVGTPVQFPNKDDIRHHVYSFSPAKPFELPLYTGTPAQPVIFDKPGVVTLGCNIHDWMIAYIYVSESPYFKITGKDGKAQIENLPAGDYKVRVWHSRMEQKEEQTQQDITIKDSGAISTSWKLTLKPELRPRRAPLPIRQGY